MRKDCHNCKFDDENYDYEEEFAVSPCVSCTNRFNEPPTNWKAKENEVKMTPEEAISRLKFHFVIHDDCRPTPYLDNACILACEALEKQIPKEPVIVTKQNVNFAQCPNCGRALFSDKYCGGCGQAIKRGE